MKQRDDFTKEQAIELAESKVWETWTDEERAKFQIIQKKLCMPFDIFHASVEKALNRSVYTNEFYLNGDDLIGELFHNEPAPTLQDIVNMIPEEKRIIINLNGQINN